MIMVGTGAAAAAAIAADETAEGKLFELTKEWRTSVTQVCDDIGEKIERNSPLDSSYFLPLRFVSPQSRRTAAIALGQLSHDEVDVNEEIEDRFRSVEDKIGRIGQMPRVNPLFRMFTAAGVTGYKLRMYNRIVSHSVLIAREGDRCILGTFLSSLRDKFDAGLDSRGFSVSVQMRQVDFLEQLFGFEAMVADLRAEEMPQIAIGDDNELRMLSCVLDYADRIKTSVLPYRFTGGYAKNPALMEEMEQVCELVDKATSFVVYAVTFGIPTEITATDLLDEWNDKVDTMSRLFEQLKAEGGSFL
jgi:hypothetical protein